MIFPRLRKKEYIRPYSELALIYDSVMDHVDYEDWANYIHTIFAEIERIPGNDILEIASGTGNFAIAMTRSGYDINGFDKSYEMINIAKQKAETADLSIPFWQGDIREFHTQKRYHAVICLYDSLNYLMTISDVIATFRNVADVLHPEGLFIFDVCTENNSRKNDHYFDERNDDVGYTRHSRYEKKEKIHINEFKINANGKLCYELHRQRIYPLHLLQDLIHSSPFKLYHQFDEFTFDRGSEESERIHFVLRKR